LVFDSKMGNDGIEREAVIVLWAARNALDCILTVYR
jgi:hypothetical protein